MGKVSWKKPTCYLSVPKPRDPIKALIFFHLCSMRLLFFWSRFLPCPWHCTSQIASLVFLPPPKWISCLFSPFSLFLKIFQALRDHLLRKMPKWEPQPYLWFVLVSPFSWQMFLFGYFCVQIWTHFLPFETCSFPLPTLLTPVFPGWLMATEVGRLFL